MHGCLYSRELLFAVAHLDFGPLRLAHQLMQEDELGTNTRPESHPFIISDKNMVSKPQL